MPLWDTRKSLWGTFTTILYHILYLKSQFSSYPSSTNPFSLNKEARDLKKVFQLSHPKSESSSWEKRVDKPTGDSLFFFVSWFSEYLSFPGGSDSKESACHAGDLGLIPGLGRSPGEGNSTPLQYSRLENSMDRGAWWAIVHGVTKGLIWPSNVHFHFQWQSGICAGCYYCFCV